VLRQVETHDALDVPATAIVAALAGKYEFSKVIGSGGSAVVHLARDTRHRRDVAIKIIRATVGDDTLRSRFLHEIAVVAQLRHPYIVPLIDSGEADGAQYYVMPYIQGESLRQRLDREGALSLSDMLVITRDVAEALDYAHDAGIVHRDIKPHNVLLDRGHALVADFGIALALESSLSDRATESGVVVGTPAYMSPEQAVANQRLDARSDVYSLGCMVYEMLAGEVPYSGSTPRAVLAKHLHAPLPDLTILRPQLSRGVQRAIEIALAKFPADRYASAGEFVAALADAESARERDSTFPRGGINASALADGTERTTWWQRLSGGAVGRVLVLGAALVAVGVILRGIAPAIRGTSAVPPDTGTYAVFDIVADSATAPRVRDLSPLVHDAVRQWTGVSVLDPSLVREQTFVSGWRVEAAADKARALGAGRFIWGEATPTRDSIRLHLRLSDVSARGLVITDRVVYVHGASATTDTVVASAVDALLLRTTFPDAKLTPATSRSLPALQAFSTAWRALTTWRLDSATQSLERAVAFDPQFGRGHLWLALVRALVERRRCGAVSFAGGPSKLAQSLTWQR
jgi:serine/threonine-protein kinase